jgi:hypothetical protein
VREKRHRRRGPARPTATSTTDSPLVETTDQGAAQQEQASRRRSRGGRRRSKRATALRKINAAARARQKEWRKVEQPVALKVESLSVDLDKAYKDLREERAQGVTPRPEFEGGEVRRSPGRPMENGGLAR